MGTDNLLEETLEIMTKHGKSPADVRWVGTDKRAGTWETFAGLANFTYDSGFGGNEIHEGLRVVGADWWLARHEYDGSEWWEFKTLPTPHPRALPLTEKAIHQQYAHQWHDDHDDETPPADNAPALGGEKACSIGIPGPGSHGEATP